MVLSFVAYSQENVGTFQSAYFKKDLSIEATQKDGKLKTVYVEVVAKDSNSAYLSIDGKNVESFKTSLELVRDKYLEWVTIAIENNVKEISKEFDIKFPKVTVAWYGTKWWFSFDNKIKMKFTILDNGKMLAMWMPKVVSSSNKYIDETIYFVFEGIEDFNP